MVRTRLAKVVFYVVPVLLLVTLLAADALQLMRPSGLAAVACTAKLFHARPHDHEIVARHHATIVDEAARFDLPPELLAAVIVDHQIALSRFRHFTDCSGSAVGANLSLGLAQMRLSTAAQLDGKLLTNLSAPEYRRLRSRVLNDESNIMYAAKELRALLEQRNRYPGLDAAALMREPAVMALILTEYRMGRLRTAAESSRLSANAFHALSVMDDLTLSEFGRDEDDVLRIRSGIRTYLDHVYCERGIFNAGVCEEWRRSLKSKTRAD
jgi:hypothetical protein